MRPISILALALALNSCTLYPHPEDDLWIDPTIPEAQRESIRAAWNTWLEAGAVPRPVYVLAVEVRGEGGIAPDGSGWAYVHIDDPDFDFRALHELGHALGGRSHHTRHGVMSAWTERVTKTLTDSDRAWLARGMLAHSIPADPSDLAHADDEIPGPGSAPSNEDAANAR